MIDVLGSWPSADCPVSDRYTGCNEPSYNVTACLRDVINRPSIAGLQARASCRISGHSTAENGIRRRVSNPMIASRYACKLKERRRPSSDGYEGNESVIKDPEKVGA